MSWNQSTRGASERLAQSFPKGRLSRPLPYICGGWSSSYSGGPDEQTPGYVHEGTGVVSDVLTSRLLLPGRVGGERDQQAGYQLVSGLGCCGRH